MKVLIVVALLASIALADDEKTAKPAAEPVICDVCKCDTKSKIIDCAERNLTATFSEAQWNATGVFDTISFEDNKIRNMTAFPALKVRVLCLRENLIDSIEANAFRELELLEELDLSMNRLTYQALRPNVFDGKYDQHLYEPLKHLKVLKLSNNKLHDLDPDIFEHLPALETLLLDNNPFHIIGSGANTAISRIPQLKHLDLSYMELTTLPAHILHSPNLLTHLHLTGNLFATLPDALGYAANLEYLNMDENPLGNMTGKNTFPPLTQLRTLSISHIMPLQQIGKGALSGLTNLTTLLCTHNPHLAELHAQALSRPGGDQNNGTEEWPPLTELRLNNNNLRVLEVGLLARWDNLHMLDVHTNPWQCDCENQWMLDTIVPLLLKQKDFVSKRLLCDEPVEMVGKELATLKEHGTKMRCLDAYGHRPEGDGTILIGVLIGLLVGIPVTLAALAAWRRSCFGMRGITGPGAAEYSRAFYKRADMQDTDLRVHI